MLFVISIPTVHGARIECTSYVTTDVNLSDVLYMLCPICVVVYGQLHGMYSRRKGVYDSTARTNRVG